MLEKHIGFKTPYSSGALQTTLVVTRHLLDMNFRDAQSTSELRLILPDS